MTLRTSDESEENKTWHLKNPFGLTDKRYDCFTDYSQLCRVSCVSFQAEDAARARQREAEDVARARQREEVSFVRTYVSVHVDVSLKILLPQMITQLRDKLQQKFQNPPADAIKIAVRLPDGIKIEYKFSPADVTMVSITKSA